MKTDSFILYIKTDDIYKNIAEDLETRLPKQKKQKCNWINER